MELLIKELRDTPGRNDKINLLKMYAFDKEVIEAFRMCYDPYTVFYITKVPKIKSSGDQNFQQQFWKFKVIAKHLCTRTLTGDDARDTMRIFLENLIPEAQEIYLNILKGDMKCGVNVSSINKAFGNIIEKFEVQLAKKYDPDKNYNEVIWYATPKLDGIRGFFKDGILFTRNGRAVIGFPHIVEELQRLCDDHDLEFLDGELYSHEIPFQKIQGYVMASKNFKEEDKKKIKFNVFALGKNNYTWKHTKEMYDAFAYIDWGNYKYTTSLNHIKCPNIGENIEKLCQDYMNQGYEGAMLRSGSVAYKWKRSDDLLKVKLFYEDDFKVTGYTEGTGKHKGKLGALIIVGKIGDKKISAQVGSGFSDEERVELWKEFWFIGKQVEVKYQGITDREVNGKWSLRFPVFNKFKLDR